jgi:hypothetical protein
MLLRKTAAGQAEVSSKAHHLPPRARSLLIMIDGKRTQEDLRAMLGAAVDEAVELLLREGLVEPMASAPRPPAPPPVTAPAPLAAPAASLEQIRRDAARAVTEALGPMADALAMRLEKARNNDELQAALRLAADALADGATRSKAEAFRQRFLGSP